MQAEAAGVVKAAALVVVAQAELAAAAQERAMQTALLEQQIPAVAAVAADMLRQPFTQAAPAAPVSSFSSTPYPYSLS